MVYCDAYCLFGFHSVHSFALAMIRRASVVATEVEIMLKIDELAELFWKIDSVIKFAH